MTAGEEWSVMLLLLSAAERVMADCVHYLHAAGERTETGIKAVCLQQSTSDRPHNMRTGRQTSQCLERQTCSVHISWQS